MLTLVGCAPPIACNKHQLVTMSARRKTDGRIYLWSLCDNLHGREEDCCEQVGVSMTSGMHYLDTVTKQCFTLQNKSNVLILRENLEKNPHLLI